MNPPLPDEASKLRAPRWARPVAIGWTLLILGACFLPGSEIPNLRVPLIDKWVHFILFGVFAFLWLRAYPSRKPARLLGIFLIAAIFGYGVEVLQGALRPWLGRSYSGGDAVADAIGGALGVGAFYIYRRRASR
jgi:VanZ family protein